MKTYLAYVRSGKEFDVEQSLAERGFDVWCGKRIEFYRPKGKRHMMPKESPFLPNYLFLHISADEYHSLAAKPEKFLAKTMCLLTVRDARLLSRFKGRVEEEYAKGQRISESQDKAAMIDFKYGEDIRIDDDVFGERLAKFRRVVEQAHHMFPLIEAEVEMMGRVVTMHVDPLTVEKAG